MPFREATRKVFPLIIIPLLKRYRNFTMKNVTTVFAFIYMRRIKTDRFWIQKLCSSHPRRDLAMRMYTMSMYTRVYLEGTYVYIIYTRISESVHSFDLVVVVVVVV